MFDFLTTPLFSEESAKALDEKFPSNRDEFVVPTRASVARAKGGGATVSGDDREVIYLCGNSLGLQPRSVRSELETELAAWGDAGVLAHHVGSTPWVTADEPPLPHLLPIVGAADTAEITVMNSLTTNLHLLMVPFYNPTPTRYRIVVERQPFPSDLYAVQSQAAQRGFDPATAIIQLGPEDPTAPFDYEGALEELLSSDEGKSVALVLWPGVQYVTGEAFDLRRMASAAHAAGALLGADLAHAVGNIPLSLHDDEVDFAVWCSYKYLNAGPGCIGGAFVHAKHHADGASATLGGEGRPQFAGWWGHELATRFDMRQPFTPIAGAAAYRLSNVPITSVCCLLASLRLFTAVGGMETLRARSLRLTGYLEALLLAEIPSIAIVTPSEPARRGAQLTLRLSAREAGGDVCIREVHTALEEAGVIADFREPDCIRIAPAPLYSTFHDLYSFVVILKELLDTRTTDA
jgi:kynureninase